MKNEIETLNHKHAESLRKQEIDFQILETKKNKQIEKMME